MVQPKEYFKIAKNAGLAGFAITDHNEINGAKKAYQLAKSDKQILVIRGIEVSSSGGHILGYGVSDPIPRHLSPEETVENITNQGGVPVAAHPYRLASGLGQAVVHDIDFSLIETINHRSPRHENNRARKLALELNAGTTGGSDAHQGWELGLAATQFNTECTTEGDVLQELHKKNITPVGESSTYMQGLHMYGKLVVHWFKRGLRRV
jgi:predicted metal-dependent phosphoesterase TrpH